MRRSTSGTPPRQDQGPPPGSGSLGVREGRVLEVFDGHTHVVNEGLVGRDEGPALLVHHVPQAQSVHPPPELGPGARPVTRAPCEVNVCQDHVPHERGCPPLPGGASNPRFRYVACTPPHARGGGLHQVAEDVGEDVHVLAAGGLDGVPARDLQVRHGPVVLNVHGEDAPERRPMHAFWQVAPSMGGGGDHPDDGVVRAGGRDGGGPPTAVVVGGGVAPVLHADGYSGGHGVPVDGARSPGTGHRASDPVTVTFSQSLRGSMSTFRAHSTTVRVYTTQVPSGVGHWVPRVWPMMG